MLDVCDRKEGVSVKEHELKIRRGGGGGVGVVAITWVK